MKEIKSGLNLGDHYEIEVTAMSMGIARSRRKAFSKTAIDHNHYIVLCCNHLTFHYRYDN